MMLAINSLMLTIFVLIIILLSIKGCVFKYYSFFIIYSAEIGIFYKYIVACKG